MEAIFPLLLVGSFIVLIIFLRKRSSSSKSDVVAEQWELLHKMDEKVDDLAREQKRINSGVDEVLYILDPPYTVEQEASARRDLRNNDSWGDAR